MNTNPSKYKVLFLSRWYPHKNDPMYGIFVQRHAEAVGLYCEVAVLYVQEDINLKGKEFEISQFELNGIETIIIYYKKRPGFLGFGKVFNVLNFLKAYYIGWKIIKKQNFKPDIIHVNILARTGLIALYLKITKKIPYIITEHWSKYFDNSGSYSGFLRKLITKFVVNKANSITTVTMHLMEAMKTNKLKNNNYFVIPNVVDVDKFFPSENTKKITKIRILHVSCFEEASKNIAGIIRSVQKLSLKRQDFELRLVGDGIDKKRLENYAQELGVKDTFVFFDGLLEGQALIDFFNSADFLVLFSNYENLPVIMVEAFACGLPVLSTNVGGIKEHLNEERGILIEAGDENAFIEKLDFMLSNYSSYNPHKIRAYAVDNFSKKVIGKSFFTIYDNVLNSK
ncbi:MAG: hypothetical protein AUJ97_01375 [Bacteroidetes bacterium CG2_30_32_10]|nr:MAG: hypothetical protein AUJ97_01375 [Bacteroidetes bacterium CG2_30_32_10]